MGQVRAIGFALVAVLASSAPARAPLWTTPMRIRAVPPCAERTAAAIVLDCPPQPAIWLDASLFDFWSELGAQADAPLPSDGSPFPRHQRLRTRDLAAVPEPGALLPVGIGLAALAMARRRPRPDQSRWARSHSAATSAGARPS